MNKESIQSKLVKSAKSIDNFQYFAQTPIGLIEMEKTDLSRARNKRGLILGFIFGIGLFLWFSPLLNQPDLGYSPSWVSALVLGVLGFGIGRFLGEWDI